MCMGHSEKPAGIQLSDLAEALKLGAYLDEAREFLASLDEQASAPAFDVTLHTVDGKTHVLRRGLTIEVPAEVSRSLLRAHIENLTNRLTALGVNVKEAE